MSSDPTSTPLHRTYSISNIKTDIIIILDLQNSKYSTWHELFTITASCYSVLNHIDGTSQLFGHNNQAWKRLDYLVHSWIYATISSELLVMVMKCKSTTRQIWVSVENLFNDNKQARAVQLGEEF